MATRDRSNEISIIRVYDAPVETVWNAWTDPKQVEKWWGPRGFSLTTHSKDLRPGGHWHYTMHGPDGVDYPNRTKYHEVEKHSKLVYDHGATEDRPPLFRVTVVFTEVNGKTRMEMRMALPTPEAADETRKFIRKAGGDATWDRLAEHLEKASSGKERFVINRTFDTPLEDMFEMWTRPELLSQWIPPGEFKMEFFRSDIRPGGSTFSVMTDGNTKIFSRADYFTIEKPNLIIYTQQFCDEDERISRHPSASAWPATILTSVILSEEASDRTRVTVVWEPHGNTSLEEINSFVKSKSGIASGWAQSFDTLEALLST